ncbi:MAG: glyoxalase family protein, partial [Solirubrobacteraceae bacterium]|nr:glyoxalase family protein [Solirubrobacteraceae bacterium]
MPDTKLDGVHHFTGVTADVTANVDFWCRILGLRFVKKTLNFETTFRYHTYYGDEDGHPGSVVTFLEFNDLERQRPGAGNIQRIMLRVGSYDAVDFWLRRLAENQVHSEMLRLDA